MVTKEQLKDAYLWYLSSKLVAFDTESSLDNEACVAWLADEISRVGLKVKIHSDRDSQGKRKQQIIACVGPEVEDGLILSGHMDVVPHANQPGWTRDPLQLQLDGERVYGRGTSDMKLFLALCVSSLKSIDMSKLRKPLALVFTCDEETGCQGAMRLRTHLPKYFGPIPLPKLCLIGEPTAYQMVVEHKGCTNLKVRVRGLAGHSSRPDLGRNAILCTGKVLETIGEINNQYLKNPTDRAHFQEFPYDYLHVAQIQGGLAANMIPESVTLVLSYRTLPGEDRMRPFEELRARIAANPELSPWVDIEYECGALGLSRSNDRRLELLLREVAPESKSIGVSFTTDAGAFQEVGIQSVVCGPGSLDQAHQPNESMALSDLLRGEAWLQSIIRRHCCDES